MTALPVGKMRCRAPCVRQPVSVPGSIPTLTDLADDEAHAGAGEASRRGVGRVSVSRLTLRGNWAACPTVIGPFVCEGVVGGRVPVVRCLRVLCGRTRERAVVP